MKCPSCNTYKIIAAKFCRHCGTKLIEESVTAQELDIRKKYIQCLYCGKMLSANRHDLYCDKKHGELFLQGEMINLDIKKPEIKKNKDYVDCDIENIKDNQINQELLQDLFSNNKKLFFIVSGFLILVVLGVSWKINTDTTKMQISILQEQKKNEEILRKNAVIKEQIVYEKDALAEEKSNLYEQQRKQAKETDLIVKNRAELENENHDNRHAYNSNQQLNSTKFVKNPNIAIGDSYIYESIYVDHPESKIVTKRTVTSTHDDQIIFSTTNLNSKKPKIRNLHFNKEWNLISSRNSDDSGLDYSPPLKYYDFPLYPEKAWQQTTTETDVKTGKTRIHTITGTVGQWEDITVPAGTFHAIKVSLVLNQSTGEKISGTDISWYVSEVRRSVKSVTTGKDGKQQIIQLLQYELK